MFCFLTNQIKARLVRHRKLWSLRNDKESKWKLAAVVFARIPSNHGLGHRFTIGPLGFYI